MNVIFRSAPLFILLTATIARAHEDTPLLLLRNGVIVGIPSPFQTPRLTVDGLGTATPRIELSVGERVTKLLPCAAKLIKSLSIDHVQVSGSWYHEERFIPYYISVHFLDAWRPPLLVQQSSYDFVFNLRTGEFIQASRLTPMADDVQYARLNASKACAIAVTERRIGGSMEQRWK